MFKKPQQSKEEMAKIFNDVIGEHVEELKNKPDGPLDVITPYTVMQHVDRLRDELLTHRKDMLVWRMQSSVCHFLELVILLYMLYLMGR